MIIWRGLGILVVIAGFAGLIAGDFITRAITNDETYYYSHTFTKLCGALLAFAFSWGMVKLLAKGNAPKVVINKETGEEILAGRGDSVFFIPSRFLPYIIFVFCFLMALVDTK